MNKQVQLLIEMDNKVKALSGYFANTHDTYFTSPASFEAYKQAVAEKYGFELEYESGIFGFKRRSFQFKTLHVGIGFHNSRPFFLTQGKERLFIGEIDGYDGTPKPLVGFDYEKIHNAFVAVADEILCDHDLRAGFENAYRENQKQIKEAQLEKARQALDVF